MPTLKMDASKVPDLSMKPLKSIQELYEYFSLCFTDQVEKIHSKIALGQSTSVLENEENRRLIDFY